MDTDAPAFNPIVLPETFTRSNQTAGKRHYTLAAATAASLTALRFSADMIQFVSISVPSLLQRYPRPLYKMLMDISLVIAASDNVVCVADRIHHRYDLALQLMTRPNTRDVLLSLIESEHAHTKMARFRKHFDLIEHALRVGVPRHTVIAGLKESGLELSEATFNNYVNRLRKRNAVDAQVSPAPQIAPSESVAVPALPATPAVQGSNTTAQPRRSVSETHADPPNDWEQDQRAGAREERKGPGTEREQTEAEPPAPVVQSAVPAPSGTSAETAPAEYRPFDVRAIRAQNYDLDALRRQWRAHEREQAAVARAAKAAATAQGNGAPVAAPGAQAPLQAAAASGSSPVSVAAPPGADTGNQVDFGSPVAPERDDSP